MKWLEKYNNGGWIDDVVKDNQGYWNPDNHGKVVEIDSNNITMKGINQELLGVSDTGDTKVMKPGEDYKFKGTKVREYPMAQDGDTTEEVTSPQPKLKPYEDLLPTLTLYKEGESCSTSNCSEFTTTEFANIAGVDRNKIDEAISADAWYKKDKILKKGGDLLWEKGQKDNWDIYQIGDFVSLGNDKYGGRSYKQPGMNERSNEGFSQENYARHSGIIIGKNEDGTPIVRHNYGGSVYDEPINDIKKADNYYPLSVYRSSQAKIFINSKNKKIQRMNLQNKISNEYSPKPSFIIKGGKSKKLYDIYKNNRKEMALNYAVEPEELDDIVKDLIGISMQESNLDNENPDDIADWIGQAIKKSLPETATTALKYTRNVVNTIKDQFIEYEINDDISSWERQIKIDRLMGNLNFTEEEAEERVFSNFGINSTTKPVTKKSYGPFKQKSSSERWKKDYHKKDLSFKDSLKKKNWGKEWNDSDDTYLQNAVGLYLDNREELREIYPEESDEFLRDATILAHNAPTKAKSSKYTSFYLKGEGNSDLKKFNSNYVNKVKKYRENLTQDNANTLLTYKQNGGWLNKY